MVEAVARLLGSSTETARSYSYSGIHRFTRSAQRRVEKRLRLLASWYMEAALRSVC